MKSVAFVCCRVKLSMVFVRSSGLVSVGACAQAMSSARDTLPTQAAAHTRPFFDPPRVIDAVV